MYGSMKETLLGYSPLCVFVLNFKSIRKEDLFSLKRVLIWYTAYYTVLYVLYRDMFGWCGVS